jgi:hypothetical protein
MSRWEYDPERGYDVRLPDDPKDDERARRRSVDPDSYIEHKLFEQLKRDRGGTFRKAAILPGKETADD